MTCEGKFESIYPALLTIIRNIAPYQRNLARATSTKMQDIFTRMARAEFLLKNENASILIPEYLDAINSILENYYDGTFELFLPRIIDASKDDIAVVEVETGDIS